MNQEFTGVSADAVEAVRRNSLSRSARRIRRIAATTTALTFMLQNFALAFCNNGATVPPGGFTPLLSGSSWSPLTFTGTLGSVWVPDNSTCENNRVGSLFGCTPGIPATGGGHDWVFDQGSTTCKETDVGENAQTGQPTAWAIPPVNLTDCIELPVFRVAGGAFVAQNFGDIPQRGAALTPTCDPTKLSTNGPNPANTYLNQLGCALVLVDTGTVQANTPNTATTYLFTAGIKSGLFAVSLNNYPTSTPGGEAGKVNSGFTYYARTSGGQRFDSAAITPDGQYLLGGSSRTNDAVFACRNPLGDPGDLTKPIDMQAFSASTNTSPRSTTAPGVQCMQIGQGGDGRIKGLAVGADGQPYFGGINIMTNFTNFPACIAVGSGTDIPGAFANNSQNHCKATPNKVLNTSPDPTATAIKVETQALTSHGNYLYRGVKGGFIYQANVDATAGVTHQRLFANIVGPSGIGFSQDNGTAAASTVLYDDPTALGLAAQEKIYKLPICEDFQ
jgi:hypothetical protein